MECWFKADSLSGENPPILSAVHDDNPDNDAGYLGAFSIFNPDVRPDLGYRISFFMVGKAASASISAFDGHYHHLAGVWSGSQLQLYYDGALVATAAAAPDPVQADCYVRLAYQDTNGGCFLGGNVGEMRIYNRALSSNEVAALYQDPDIDTVGDGIPNWWRAQYFSSGTTTDSTSCASCDPDRDGFSNFQEAYFGTDPTNSASYPASIPASLVLWWKLDEGTGTTVADASGNKYSGTLQWNDSPPVWTNGVVSGALNFDGSQNYAGCDYPISQTFTAATMECWFTADSLSGENPAILTTVHDDNPDNDAGYLGALSLYNPDVRPDLGYLVSFFMVGEAASAPINAFDGYYHHVAGVWDGSQIYLYYDGVLVATTAAPSDPVQADCYVRLAYQDSNGGCFLGGNVGEARIYNRALGSNEVAASFNTDTIGDGIPDWWRLRYYGSGTTTDSYSCASCTSTNPWAHGLSNSQVYQNPSVLLADNYSTINDGIPDWWKVQYGFSLTDPSVATGDADGDGWSNLDEYLRGTNPLQADPPVDFIVNGGQPYSPSLTVSVQPLSTNYPNILVSLDPSMSNVTVLAYAGTPTSYTLPDNGDGGYELFLQFADAEDQPHGPILSKVVVVDRTPPVTYITSPVSNAVLDQAFITLQAVAYDPNPVAPDAARPLKIWINGQPFWDRDGTNIVIERFPVPAGTNSFTVTIQVADQAGNSNQTTQTWMVDPSGDTTAPQLSSFNIATNMLLPDVGTVWVEGAVDDSNALVNAIVSSDSGDVTTNALHVRGLQIEGSVPLEFGTNQLVLLAFDAAGNTTSNAFMIITSDRYRFEITSPAFGEFATAPSNTVSGYVSALFDEGLPTQTNVTSVFINGVAAVLGTNIDANGNLSFTTTNAIGLGVPITGFLAGPGIPTDPPPDPPAMSQVYEVTEKVEVNDVIAQDPEAMEEVTIWDVLYDNWRSYCGWANFTFFYRQTTTTTQELDEVTGQVSSNWTQTSFDMPYDTCLTTLDPDQLTWETGGQEDDLETMPGPIDRGLSFGTYSYDHGAAEEHGLLCTDPYANEYRALERVMDKSSIRFRAPRQYDTNTTVIFTFEGVDYRRRDGVPLDLSQISFRGQSPIAYSNEAQTVSYLITVDGGKEYTICEDDFTWPSDQQFYEEYWSDTYPCDGSFGSDSFGGNWTEDMHWLTWTNFHNANPSVKMTAYRPQTPPFQRYSVPDNQKVDPGAGIRVDGNGGTNRIEVTLTVGAMPTPDGMKYFLKRSNDSIKVWTGNTNGVAILDTQDDQEIDFTNTTQTVWVEDVTSGSADLELQLRSTNNNSVVNSDKVHFYSFTSIVIALGGRTQVPHDPVTPLLPDTSHPGAFDIGRYLYLNGYDVHMYNEADVGSSPGASVPYTEVQSAVQNRNVSNIAIFGYSYGGGATYNLAGALNTTLAFTAYIDAVIDPFPGIPCIVDGAQTNWPSGSSYHVNYYQSPHTLAEGCLGGEACTPPASYEFNLGSLVNHYTIDDNGGVQIGIEQKLQQHVSR
jgi:hypothetical protein